MIREDEALSNNFIKGTCKMFGIIYQVNWERNYVEKSRRRWGAKLQTWQSGVYREFSGGGVWSWRDGL